MKRDRLPESLCFYAKYLSYKGLITGSEGNLSVRTEHGFWITPSGRIKENLKKNDLVFMYWDRDFVERGVSSEWGMHKLIYLVQPKAKAIVHTHPFYVLLVDAFGFDFKSFELREAKVFIDQVERVPFLPPGSKELWERVSKAALRTKTIVLEKHGLVVWDESLEKAVNFSLILEKMCKFNWYNYILKALETFLSGGGIDEDKV